MKRLALILLALTVSAGATSYVPPRPLLIGSDFGIYGFKFLPRGVSDASASARESWGELFMLQPDGRLKTLWKRRLVNTPSRILISPRGQVVTLDNWAGSGSPRHAVVVYDLNGKVTADLKFSDVVAAPDACPRCFSMDGPFLSWGFAPKFVFYGEDVHLALRDFQGKGPSLNLVTGKLKTVWNGQPRP
ncbi:hypothetical protein QOL99_12060 [Deinococcus sp. MIMF12]|uniref:Uncharacterized protein n=1 Tax=Deinococcus rhizophilus TaxID=3049544 RepID=A0ABT7JIJ7_9DEIO|nr:hypothetical protein [Deinococcus rhizophilus]MDL2344880.1 hypothetical protein [Deinococcus rhizophilus]